MISRKDSRTLTIVAIIVAILLFNNAQLGAIFLSSSQVQYNNEPILIQFTTQNYTDPTITTFLNSVELIPFVEGSNETIKYTSAEINGTYTILVEGVTGEGILTISVQEDNLSESQSIEIKNPFVDIKHEIPNIVERGSQTPLEITTFTPQGDALDADEISVDIFDPNNNKETIVFDKVGNKFTTTFVYASAGNYQFKVHARMEGFETREQTIITSVTKTQGIHPIVWIWVIFITLFILLVIIKQIRKRL